MYDAITIAEYLIGYSTSQGTPVSNLRLQKVLYFVQAEFMVSKGEPCFRDTIEAWDLGPVVPNVYREYKIFGASSIPVVANNGDIRICADDISIINDIVDGCNKYSTSTLVEFTHNQAPWVNAHSSQNSNVITPESLRDFFEKEES